MATKQERTQRLIGIFNESQGLDDFRLIVRQLKANNIRLTHIYNRNAGPAHFDNGAMAIQVNMAFSDEALRIALDHEGTHADQEIHANRYIEGRANIGSTMCMRLFGEAHAYSNQSEFAVKRYLEALAKGTAQGSIAEKAFDGFFKKNGVAGRSYLKAYIQGPTGVENITLQRPSDVTSALNFYHYNHALRGENLQPRLIKARKAAVKAFFSVDVFKNNPVMDEYIKSYIAHFKQHQDQYAKRTGNMSLKEILSPHKTNNLAFLSEKDLKEALDIDNKDSFLAKILTFSAHRGEYNALMQEIHLSQSINKGFGFADLFKP